MKNLTILAILNQLIQNITSSFCISITILQIVFRNSLNLCPTTEHLQCVHWNFPTICKVRGPAFPKPMKIEFQISLNTCPNTSCFEIS